MKVSRVYQLTFKEWFSLPRSERAFRVWEWLEERWAETDAIKKSHAAQQTQEVMGMLHRDLAKRGMP